MFKCFNCQKDFKGREKNHIYKFCSHHCYSINLSKKRGDRTGGWKGGRIKRGKYWYIRIPNHPDGQKQGYIAEHRLIMEKKIGRRLLKEEVVHHINEDPTDNRPENLELMKNRSDHNLKHFYIKYKKTIGE